jgi:uncharacterized membrane protein YdjX (TVP38/TMEM64 family)
MIKEHPRARAVYEALLGSGPARSLFIVTLVRLSPNSPYAVTNLAFAAAGVNFVTYVIGTLLGIAPRTGVVVFIASRLANPQFEAPLWLWIAGILVTLLVLAIIAQISRQALARVTAPIP